MTSGLFEIPKIDPETAGVVLGWWIVAKIYVLMRCAHGHVYTLQAADDGHAIADDGAVSPSIICPYTGCGFHETARLLDWVPLGRR